VSIASTPSTTALPRSPRRRRRVADPKHTQARNAWAGAAHWKAAARPKAAPKDGPAKKKKRAAAKRESDLDFGGPPPDKDALAPPPPKRGGADPLALGPAALQRLHAGARDLVLPPDLRVTPGQLRRLFLLEDVAVAACVEVNQCVGCSSSRRRVDGVEDDAMIKHERAVKF